MNTDTPETDAHLLGGSYSFDASFARKLERQRNKAIDECIALRQMVRELRDALQRVADNGHAEDCLLLNRANAECDCGVDAAYLLITKANQLLP